MRVLIYEHTLASPPSDELGRSLIAEGTAIVQAVLTTLASVETIELSLALDRRHAAVVKGIENLGRVDPEDLDDRLSSFDAAVVLAPEFDDLLAETVERCRAAGVEVFASDTQTIRQFSDKLLAADWFGDYAIPSAPLSLAPGRFVDDWRDKLGEASSLPLGRVVVKPVLGAGAMHTYVCRAEEAESTVSIIRDIGFRGPLLVQPYVPGVAASVAAIVNAPARGVILPPVRQQISWTGLDGAELLVGELPNEGVARVGYDGGSLPLPEEQVQRCVAVMLRVLERAPSLKGYFGLDLVVAPPHDPASALIVEINPRLTTSLVAYAALMGEWLGPNLLGLDDAQAEDLIVIASPMAKVSFDAAGRIS